MVAPDFIGNCRSRTANTLVIDNKTGIWEMASDLERNRLPGVRKILLMTARVDWMANRDIVMVLEHLQGIVEQLQESPEVWITGPLPRLHDTSKTVEEFCQESLRIADWIKRNNVFSYSSVSDVLIDTHRPGAGLINHNGLSINALQEIQAILPW